VPEIHGRDAGTLIAWMNSRGMQFAKPNVGEEAAYQQLYTMMHELYALSGAPILDVPRTTIPPPIELNNVPARGIVGEEVVDEVVVEEQEVVEVD
jgi:hypothetical protein